MRQGWGRGSAARAAGACCWSMQVWSLSARSCSRYLSIYLLLYMYMYTYMLVDASLVTVCALLFEVRAV